MDTTKILALTAILAAAGCAGEAATETVGGAATSDVTGAWSFTMQPDSRPGAGARCDGDLSLSQAGTAISGSFTCVDGRRGRVFGTDIGARELALSFYGEGLPASDAAFLNTTAQLSPPPGTTLTGAAMSAMRR